MNDDPVNKAQSQTTPSQLPEYQLLLKYIHRLLRYKFRVSVIAILGAGIVFGLSWLLEERFSAQVTVAINTSERPGGIKPTDYRGGNTIGVLEYDFIIDGAQTNERERHLARMGSFGFISMFLKEQDLLPWLYAKDWNAEQQTWNEGSEPDMREAVKKFKAKVLYFDIEKKTELLNIRMTVDQPEFAARLANKFVLSFNNYIRAIDAEELKTRRDYLEHRLSEVRNTQMHRSIYRLLEAQLAVESLIYARENYPLEMIQPATEPLFESYPPRKKWTALTLVGLLFVGFGVVVIAGVVGKLRQDLKAYAKSIEPVSPIPNAAAITNTREEWIDEPTR
ncbi:MAG: hypothetical protein CMF25_07505 [Kangiellaceae bacterium]|jgi:LPS O-antigen subunit length determinant protein (WzzB/FepE family)|nr:hypothetical protein [Kangiellaceae bacterium]|tara:strand:- start:248 stop:1255 length:1008 start_codon:yes stop_codon:yes gene_type:complete